MGDDIQEARLKTAIDELADPSVNKFLRSVELLPSSENSGPADPAQRQLEDYKLKISKYVGGLVATAGGLGAATTAVGAALAAFRDQVGAAVVVSLVAGGALIVTAAIFGLAIVMQADVRGRASIAKQIAQERGLVLRKLTDVAASPSQAAAPSPSPSSPTVPTEQSTGCEKANETAAESVAALRLELRVMLAIAAYTNQVVITTGDGPTNVLGVRVRNGQLQLLQSDRYWVDVAEVETFSVG